MSIRKVLVVDDSATDREALGGMLERHGYRVLHARDGEQGVALARSEIPDLILMDIVMPAMNGFQATRTLARDPLTRHIPIVVCSSKREETDRVWGMRQGARGYLTKPVDERQLLDVIAALARPVAV